MDHPKDKAIFDRDAESMPPHKGTANSPRESSEDQIDCTEDHDFDIVFEFETPPHGPN